MANNSEINNGYIEFIKNMSKASNISIRIAYFAKFLFINLVRIVLIPFVYIYAFILVGYLKIRIHFLKKNESDIHKKALEFVPELVAQYPMHLYPVVAKAIELAFIKTNIDKYIDLNNRKGIVEFAIGDGTLSQKVFKLNDKITAFDINPYSLYHVKDYSHVQKRIIADCLTPPIIQGGAFFIISNNLLHHIEDKNKTLENWSEIAEYALFNENTVFWANSWTKPYILRKLGFKKIAQKSTNRIAEHSLQALLTEEELKRLVRNHFEALVEFSFLKNDVFFLCANFSSLMLCYGPPTPRLNKAIFNKIFAGFSSYLTTNLANLLITYDACLKRKNDTFITWIVKSKIVTNPKAAENISLKCPKCCCSLVGKYCSQCDTDFPEIDGMLFLLNDENLEQIIYNPEKADVLGHEHL
jgi:2-polyprenyl-3-methyl-5-hydroxy-6-metoxy-1,4-benzoquinol methylase